MKRLVSHERLVVQLDRRLTNLARLSNRYAWVRLLTFAAGALISLGLLVTGSGREALIATAIGLIVFEIEARAHRRVKDSITRHRLWREIKLAQIARLKLDWEHIPLETLSHPPAALEADLDLVGEHSLHRLIDVAVSREGSDRLRGWLAAGVADPRQFHERQLLVRELAPLAVFRDRLRLNAALASQGRFRRWEGKRLLDWLAGAAPAESAERLKWLALGLTGLGLFNAVLFALHRAGTLPPYWGLTFIVYAGIYLWSVQNLGDPFSTGLALRDPLHDLGAVLEHLETGRCGQKAGLCRLLAPLREGERRPSAQLRRLSRVLAAASVRGNPLLWTLISVVLPWDIYVAYALHKRQAALAALLPVWLDVWFELEALNGLANFAYLHPGYMFPELAEPGESPVFEARALGHPLIPDRVCNDFALQQLGDLAMITGSNMSGKSTFLRTLGINLCLMIAGGPVVAEQLRAVPFRLFTCIRVSDSVTDGISYFYAEVKCLKALLAALEQEHPFPLFFLIDEIFRGTNNRERLIGSRSYTRALVGRRGVGAISTHDLELVRLADVMPAIKNYHFEETIADGRMLFDYRLRSGPCPTTNALAIMRLEGLPVEE